MAVDPGYGRALVWVGRGFVVYSVRFFSDEDEDEGLIPFSPLPVASNAAFKVLGPPRVRRGLAVATLPVAFLGGLGLGMREIKLSVKNSSC